MTPFDFLFLNICVCVTSLAPLIETIKIDVLSPFPPPPFSLTFSSISFAGSFSNSAF